MRWDEGICWHLEQVTGPDLDDDTLSVAIIRDDHLRGANGSAEDDYLDRLRKVSYRSAERGTWRAHLPQAWAMVLSRFPYGAGDIVIPKPPLQSVTSITYIDEDGTEQEMLGSPAEFQVIAPSGPKAQKGRIRPLYDQVWPDTRVGLLDAVRIEFECGYPLVGSPAVVDIPEDIDQARLLVIGEMYKQRSESTPNMSPAMIRAKDIWLEYRAW